MVGLFYLGALESNRDNSPDMKPSSKDMNDLEARQDEFVKSLAARVKG